MKKALIIGAAILAVLASAGLWFRNKEAVITSAGRPWPREMGPLDTAANRWPPMKANSASVELATLAKALPESKVVDEFVANQITRGELTIADPPPLPDVSAIRELLLREPIVWERRVEFDDPEVAERRTMQMTVARSLVASALGKARANNPAAWEDLSAAWKLARSIEDHPQMMAQTAALTILRMINAVAWKMPLPAPAWIGELHDKDSVRLLLEGFQYQSAYYLESGVRIFPTKWLAKSIDHDRAIAEEVVNLNRCEVNIAMNELGTDLSSVWRRAFRHRAEREATANALRVREGKRIETSSQCSDGSWAFDGTTLRFSREIETAAPDRPMPLQLRVKP
jgi:hypothetical protein